MRVRELEVLYNGTEDELEYYEAMQAGINSGSVWRLEGSMGRAAMAAIESGHCVLGHEPCFDYYGSMVPSRSMVKDGTKGSVSYSAEKVGPAWAAQIAKVGEKEVA